MKQDGPDILASLRERAKELSCLYRVEEILLSDEPISLRLQRAAEAIPSGWFDPDRCEARIAVSGRSYASPGYEPGRATLSEEILVRGEPVGSLTVTYPGTSPDIGAGSFLPEERKLAGTLARSLAQTILHENLGRVFSGGHSGELRWLPVLEMLFVTDRKLYKTLCRRLLNYLIHRGVPSSEELLDSWLSSRAETFDPGTTEEMLSAATSVMPPEDLSGLIQRWMGESRIEGFMNVLEDHASTISDILRSMEEHRAPAASGADLSRPVLDSLKVGLIRRFIGGRPGYIGSLKERVTLEDFRRLSGGLVFPAESHGGLGGRGAWFFLAEKLLEELPSDPPVEIPATVYVAPDGMLDFIHLNRLEEFLQNRYRNTDELRLEYPGLVQLFTSCEFSTEMSQGLSMALDRLGDGPLAVRSSSLLQNGSDSSFSGMYGTVFLANRGSRGERLQGLKRAVSMVYASMFAPDPIRYRLQRGLLDCQEEMGIVIQRVVGRTFGNMFFPAFTAAALGSNQFIPGYHDIPVSFIPGLGTGFSRGRGIRLPVVAPRRADAGGFQGSLSSAPDRMDVLNLAENRVEEVSPRHVLKACGEEYPLAGQIFSDPLAEYPVASFQGLVRRGEIPGRIRETVSLLMKGYGHPVDTEFAFDGRCLYLIRFGPQTLLPGTGPGSLFQPGKGHDILLESNDRMVPREVSGITHVVYMSREGLRILEARGLEGEIPEVLLRLGSILPRGRFMVIAPGLRNMQTGSISAYSQFGGAAAVAEISSEGDTGITRRSWGTGFFRNLVESSTAYLNFDPERTGCRFNGGFFREGGNRLADFLPDASHLAGALRVIHIPSETGGRTIGVSPVSGGAAVFLTHGNEGSSEAVPVGGPSGEEHWRWRQRMAEEMAGSMDTGDYGVRGVYLFGSAKNATAGPRSDIDLIIHITEDPGKKNLLKAFLRGWDTALRTANLQRTGIRLDSILDVHLITDEDIRKKSSYAVRIGAVTDPARRLVTDKGAETTV